jgi:hypothetical protein
VKAGVNCAGVQVEMPVYERAFAFEKLSFPDFPRMNVVPTLGPAPSPR